MRRATQEMRRATSALSSLSLRRQHSKGLHYFTHAIEHKNTHLALAPPVQLVEDGSHVFGRVLLHRHVRQLQLQPKIYNVLHLWVVAGQGCGTN